MQDKSISLTLSLTAPQDNSDLTQSLWKQTLQRQLTNHYKGYLDKFEQSLAWHVLYGGIHEFVANSLDAKANSMTIKIELDENNIKEIILTDNGEGFKKSLQCEQYTSYKQLTNCNLGTQSTKDSNHLGGKGFGLKCMSNILHKLKGDLKIRMIANSAAIKLINSPNACSKNCYETALKKEQDDYKKQYRSKNETITVKKSPSFNITKHLSFLTRKLQTMNIKDEGVPTETPQASSNKTMKN